MDEPILIKISKRTIEGKTSQSHIIYDSNPHIKSLAAYILLRNELLFQDEDFVNDPLNKWLEFREIYLNNILKQNGDLVCAYCGKKHLEIGGRTPQDFGKNNKNPNLATIDHIDPLSNGGAKYDEKNLCVACKKCNMKKGNKPVEIFTEKIFFQKL